MSVIETEAIEIVEFFEPITIAVEQATGTGVLVPLPKAMIEEIQESDNDPRFATFVIESGWSRSKRFWGEDIFRKAQEQIEESSMGEPIVGYLGHIRPENDPFDFPDIQFHWLKSKLQMAGDKARLFVKAHVLPDTKARYYLSKKLARTVSWRGPVSQIPFQHGVKIRDFTLESIDLARPRAAGMSARMVGGLTSEMEERTDEGRNDVKPDEIAALQENELRAHNAGLVTSIETAAAKPHLDKVSEMSTEVETLKPQADLIPEIRKLFGMKEDADVLEVLSNVVQTMKQAGQTVVDGLLDKVLEKKFTDSKTRGLVRRVLVGEMRSNESFEPTGDAEKDEAKIAEMVNEIVDKDDDLKEMVSEMEELPASPAGAGSGNSDQERGGKRELKPGFTNKRIRVKSVGRG